MEWVAVALLSGLGAFAMAKAASALLLRVRMRRWPRAEGTVRKAWTHVSGGGRRATYRANFEVAFRHAGAEHVALCDSPTRASYNERRGAEEDVSRHPPGSRVLVYVNPDQPAASHLKLPEAHVISFLLMGALVPIAAACAATLEALSPRHHETAVLLFFLTVGAALCLVAVAAFVALLRKA